MYTAKITSGLSNKFMSFVCLLLPPFFFVSRKWGSERTNFFKSYTSTFSCKYLSLHTFTTMMYDSKSQTFERVHPVHPIMWVVTCRGQLCQPA